MTLYKSVNKKLSDSQVYKLSLTAKKFYRSNFKVNIKYDWNKIKLISKIIFFKE